MHAKYRSSFDPSDPVARFNERFLLSLSASPACLVLDDELNVLPVSKGKDIRPLEETPASESSKMALKRNKEREQELSQLKEEVAQTKVVAEVVKHTKTLDQARVVLTILDVLASSSLSTTVALTAGRGRGKSAALGLSIAAAIAHGYANIFVTSPSPENLRTLFEFLFKGLQALGYEEVADWDLQRGTGEWKDVVVRVNVFRGHRQTIQYIAPTDAHVLGQAELVVIDEAAAIPLTLVRNLMGPYLVFLSSTINGYEGTGRSLSLKLIQQLRDNAKGAADAVGASNEEEGVLVARGSEARKKGTAPTLASRNLKEVSLDEPIRYSDGDEVEKWLHQLLCLDASLKSWSSKKGSPHPSTCTLFEVNRDALFSFHPASEIFLQRMLALYVASHYKNSPNDLQLMSDAPGHRLFVLLAPVDSAGSLPEPLCVLQVALEGNVSRQSILNSLSRGTRDAGDLVPWTVSQQFQDADFAGLSGARVVRVAVHPDHARAGYGSRAIECLRAYYAGELFDADSAAAADAAQSNRAEIETFASVRDQNTGGGLQEEKNSVAVRDGAKMPALLERLSDKRPEAALDWVGVSFGFTPALFRFWKRNGFVPLYVRQTQNELTGEYTAVMVRGADKAEKPSWLGAFAADFRRRFISLLGFRFRDITSVSALSVLEAATAGINSGANDDDEKDGGEQELSFAEIRTLLSPFDMKRLLAFGNNIVDYTVILDLLPTIASLYFNNRLFASDTIATGAVVGGEEDTAAYNDDGIKTQLKLSGIQSATLLALGLQRKDPTEIEREMGLPTAQALALFVKAVRRITACLQRVEKAHHAREMAAAKQANGGSRSTTLQERKWEPIAQSVEEELKEAGKVDEQERKRREEQRELLKSMDLDQYAIDDGEVDTAQKDGWKEAEARAARLIEAGAASEASTIVSVRSNKAPDEESGDKEAKKRKQDQQGNRSKKMRS